MNLAPLVVSLGLAIGAQAGGNAFKRPAQPSTEPAQPAAPEALTDAELADRIDTYLSVIDTRVSAAQWKALGPKAVPRLEAIALDANGMPGRRSGALDALSILGGARARSALTKTARAEGEPFAVRASALHGAGRAMTAKQLTTAIRPVLEGARDPSVRATAAHVLAVHAPTSCDAIQAQADREPASARHFFTSALEQCGRAR